MSSQLDSQPHPLALLLLGAACIASILTGCGGGGGGGGGGSAKQTGIVGIEVAVAYDRPAPGSVNDVEDQDGKFDAGMHVDFHCTGGSSPTCVPKLAPGAVVELDLAYGYTPVESAQLITITRQD